MKGNRSAFKTVNCNCRDDLMGSRQRSTWNDLLKRPLLRVTSHDLILSHQSLGINAKNNRQDLFLLACREQHWGMEDISHLQELATKVSWKAMGGQPPRYIFFINIVFKMSVKV